MIPRSADEVRNGLSARFVRPLVILLIVLSIIGFIGTSIEEAREQARNLRSAGMILIQGGCYEMGDRSGKGAEDERPVHMACVDPFYLGKAEVTVEAFSRFVEETGYQTEASADKPGGQTGRTNRADKPGGQTVPHFVRTSSALRPHFVRTSSDGCESWDGANESSPAVCVSWNDASHYIEWMKNKSPKKAMGYRLPTEAEWEFTARNYDMGGNVNQWMLDWYDEGFYKRGHKANPRGPSEGKFRVIRGGSWPDEPVKRRLSSRKKELPDYRSSHLGFRLALGVSDR
ncbi:MAG: SUMF1/EgtB/PvdO family nonheme iron enzyme [Nitrospirae bacterium]|nr:SUMF1/EgtB/PvdO family nonheme iron enzyme [Nitrospirota bacterium]